MGKPLDYKAIQLVKRWIYQSDVKRSKLAHSAGVEPSALTRVLNGEQGLDRDGCIDFFKAFKSLGFLVPQEEAEQLLNYLDYAGLRHQEKRIWPTKTRKSPRQRQVIDWSSGLGYAVNFGRYKNLAVHVLACDREISYRENDIDFIFEDIKKKGLPAELEQTRQELLMKVKHEVQQRDAPCEDNPAVYVRRFTVKDEEWRELEVTFGPSSYFEFVPFHHNLDRNISGRPETIRQVYYSTPEAIGSTPIPLHATVSLNVICDDGNTILIPRRSQHVAVSPGQLSETVAGSINLQKDCDPATNCPSPYLAAAREADKEMGLHISTSQIVFRAIVLCLYAPAVVFMGDVYLKEGSSEILDRIPFAPQRENKAYYPVEFQPDAVSKFLFSNKDQAAAGSVFSYLVSLVSQFGLDRTMEAFR